MCKKVDAYKTHDDKLFQHIVDAEKHELEIAAKNLAALDAEGFKLLAKGEVCAEIRRDLLLIADALRDRHEPRPV